MTVITFIDRRHQGADTTKVFLHCLNLKFESFVPLLVIYAI